MKISEIPWDNRPGMRLKKEGVDKLSNAELLAIVLGRGNFKENAVDISNRVLNSYNFDKMSDLSFHELKDEFKNQVPAMKIQAMYEIFRRTNKLKKSGNRIKIKTAEDVFNYFVDEISDKKKEHFYVLFLDTKNIIIGKELVSVGTLNASLIHPREVFKGAIKASANSVILVHNHPSGDCKASKNDIRVTDILNKAGCYLGINVLDHIIVGNDKYFSFQENNMLS
jgi:DNA repair protein RadC